jgi:hypothetical protein
MTSNWPSNPRGELFLNRIEVGSTIKVTQINGQWTYMPSIKITGSATIFNVGGRGKAEPITTEIFFPPSIVGLPTAHGTFTIREQNWSDTRSTVAGSVSMTQLSEPQKLWRGHAKITSIGDLITDDEYGNTLILKGTKVSLNAIVDARAG